MNNGRSLTSEHRRHDRLLVTRFAMDDAYPSERAEAQTLVESCADCASLAADIRQVATAVARLPRPVRTRDFSITVEQAERLRGSRVTRWLRSLGTPGWAVLRPVAGAALSIGLVMAVAGAALPRMETAAPLSTAAPFSAGDMKSTPGQADNPAPMPTPLPMEVDPAGPPVGPIAVPGVQIENMAGASQDPVTQRVDTSYVQPTAAPGTAEELQPAAVQPAVDPTRGLLIYAGLAVAVVSFGLLVLAWLGRRYFADPLLR